MNWLAVNIHVKEMLMQTMQKKPQWKNTAGFVTSQVYVRHFLMEKEVLVVSQTGVFDAR